MFDAVSKDKSIEWVPFFVFIFSSFVTCRLCVICVRKDNDFTSVYMSWSYSLYGLHGPRCLMSMKGKLTYSRALHWGYCSLALNHWYVNVSSVLWWINLPSLWKSDCIFIFFNPSTGHFFCCHSLLEIESWISNYIPLFCVGCDYSSII